MFFNFMYCFVYFTLYIKITLSLSLVKESKDENVFHQQENINFTLMQKSNTSLMTDEMISGTTNNNTKIRVKRQGGGASKFTDAAKMPQVKIMRLFTQLFKNFWDMAYVGGPHPLHPEVPKVVVALYKQKIVEFFVPDVGEDPNKQ